ncbi:hypothetical protein IGS75_15180 (plasmid) [Gluconobacter sphaericus]|uniref:hypothetical protein n=1 Tax=Gluconobacter sphaericus TaxID=574987 RepID=UPI0019237F6E|nr:hypothetical protein [Gluconobacter sphaericus]QQX92805.1 hypothetical protein IGS75_15180 [Gluconobacter sphaericus]
MRKYIIFVFSLLLIIISFSICLFLYCNDFSSTKVKRLTGEVHTGENLNQSFSQGKDYNYINASKRDPMAELDAFRIGGKNLGFAYGGSPISAGSQGSIASLDLQGHPYGMYAQGCIFCVMTGQSDSFRPGITGGDWTVGTAASVLPGDSVAEYIETENERALMVLDVDHYDAPVNNTDADAVLKTPLTAQQMVMLRVGMWIHTNSIDGESTEPSCETLGGHAGCSLPRQNWYRSVVKGWSSDGKKIYVTQWVSPTSSKSTVNGQIPPTDAASIDTLNSNWRKPVIFVGITPNVNGRNENLFYRHAYSSGTGGALGHAILSNEIDMMYLTTENHEVKVTGDDFVAENLVGSTTFNHDSVTEDSHFMLFNGDLPIGLWLNLGATADMIKSPSFNVHGNEGVSRAEARLATTEIWSQGFADGADAFNLLGYLQAETINAPSLTGANGTSYHFGVHIGGTNTTPTNLPNNWGEMIWNPKGQNQGSFGMCGGGSTGTAEACGVIQTQSGPVIMPYQVSVKNGGITSGNGLVIGKQPSGHAAALGIYQDASNIDNILEFMEGSRSLLSLTSKGNLIISSNITASGMTTFSGKLIIPFGTPTSSTAPCKQGQMEMDATYTYSCVVANTWHRVANGASW